MSTTKNWLDGKGFLLDITGVLYDSGGPDGGTVIPGSIEAVQLLRKEKIPFRFLTNESTATRDHLCKKLNKLGFDIKVNEITAPAPLAVKILRERSLRPFLLTTDEVTDEFKDINTMNPNCVVIGDAQHNFTYENVNRAFSVLSNSTNPVLLSMGCGRYYKETDGLKIDVGAYAKGLEYACSLQAEYIGKPDTKFFTSAVEELRLSCEECCMIGDDVKNDVGGAQQAGLMGLLVKTGKYKVGDEKNSVDGVVNDLLSAVKIFIEKRNR